MTPLSLHLRDLSQSLVAAWRREFDGIPSVEISRGDIFSSKEGVVNPGDPIDIRADAIVSPANSFGFMDGGIDAVYTFQLGAQLQENLQAELRRTHGGELPVGQAVIVNTRHPDIPWCVSAPTMRVPMDVSTTVNAFLAFRAALLAVLRHNESNATKIRTLLCPGLGTAVGRMPPDRCARQMRAAWRRVIEGQHSIRPPSPTPPTTNGTCVHSGAATSCGVRSERTRTGERTQEGGSRRRGMSASKGRGFPREMNARLPSK